MGSSAMGRDGTSYFDGQREARADAQAYDPDAREKLWGLSARLAGLE